MEEGDFGAAVSTLEAQEPSPELDGMWSLCGEAALAAGNMIVAERCAVAVGDVARAKFLRKVRLGSVAAQRCTSYPAA